MTSQWDVVYISEQARLDQINAEARETIRRGQRLQRVMYGLSALAAFIVIWNR